MPDEVKNEELENQAEFDNTSEQEAVEQASDAPESPQPDATNVQQPDASEVRVVNSSESQSSETGNINLSNLELLQDVALDLTVELGRTEMQFREVLQLGIGSIVELNKFADKPVDIYVNQSKIAEGEVVVIGEHFGVRVSKLLHQNEGK